MSSKVKKRMTKFKKALLIYSGVLCIPMIIFLIYVTNSLIRYEDNQIEKYINKTIKDIEKSAKEGKLSEIIEDLPNIPTSKFEREDITLEEGLKDLINAGEITYKLNENSKDEIKPIYDLYLCDELLFTLSLDGSEKENRLGLLNYSIWKTDKLTNQISKGIFSYEILVPNNYTVLINDLVLTKEDIEESLEDEALSELSKYQQIAYQVRYKVNNLIKKPSIVIKNNNNEEVEYEIKDNKIEIALDTRLIKNTDEALQIIGDDIGIMKIAEDWSLFLSRDLKGTLHGYYDIKKYLIENSELEKYAYKWATNIDIMFISAHTLDYPTFTNERLENFEIYSDKAFSCETYLEKNMTLKDGQKMKDIMHERLYFSKEESGWKLVNMQTLKGETKSDTKAD